MVRFLVEVGFLDCCFYSGFGGADGGTIAADGTTETLRVIRLCAFDRLTAKI